MESPEMEEEGRGCSQAEGSDPNLRRRKKKKRRQNKRRFSDDQIRLLESMFEAETKPEPVKKVELARELGLQPRQVAIWFQNKRARWKAKQIEQEYKALSADYESLKSKFESLEKDKQSLLLQLQRLSSLLEKSTHEGSRGSEGLALNSSDGGSENGRTLCGSEANRGFLKEEPENGGFMCLDGDEEDDKNTRIGHFESDPIPNHMDQQQMEGFSTSPDEEWCSLDSSGLFSDQNCGSSQWWNFWT